jgi:hypothetical protein
MYNYMVFNVADKKLHRDFLAYHKECDSDDYYVVSMDDPELLKYLEEFLDRRRN